MKLQFIVLASLAFLCSFKMDETQWTQDKMHSQLNFSAKHFGISTIEGRFQNYSITMKSEALDFSDLQIEVIADVSSINTYVEMRDTDLKSPNWLDATRYPTFNFKSTSITQISGTKYKLKGNLSLHGITKPVVFDLTLNGWAVTMTKKNTAGFTLRGKIRRSDYKVGASTTLTGVGDEITIWSNTEIGKN